MHIPLFFRMLFVLLLSTCMMQALYAQQDIKRIQLKQGKLIGSLPYGQHFYIYGNASIDEGRAVDEVFLEIFDTGVLQLKRKRDVSAFTAGFRQDVSALQSGSRLVATSQWSAAQAENTGAFELYVNVPLEVRKQYLAVFTFVKKMELELSGAEKEQALARFLNKAYARYEQQGGISATELREILNAETRTILAIKLENLDDPILSSGEKRGDDLFLDPVIDDERLQELAELLGRVSSARDVIENTRLSLEQEIEPMLAEMSEEDENYAVFLEEKRSAEQQIAQREARIAELQADIQERLQVVRQQRVRVKTVYADTDTEVSVADLANINIGTAFGASSVGLNLSGPGEAEYDVLSYTALKFYFLPVDKRIHDPYVNAVFINRLSFLLGLSFNKDLDYRGAPLDDLIGFFPMLGLSYDVNRYFSIDLGATLFEQDNISPVLEQERVRLGPILGITFDMDLMNRFRTAFSGENYLIQPN